MPMPLANPREGVSLPYLTELAEWASQVLDQDHAKALAPNATKQPPRMTSVQLLEALDVSRSTMERRLDANQWPADPPEEGHRRTFDLDQARQILKLEGKSSALHGPAQVITISNFKGGAGKTTLSASLAQYLAMRGLDVLAIDLDPQASLTTLYGYLPDVDVDSDGTLMRVLHEEDQTLAPAVRTTYWPGVDLLPSCLGLAAADYIIPARQAKDPNYRMEALVAEAIRPLRDKYDVIIIDTPPALGYLTTAAIYAASGLVMPIPPSGMDFASSCAYMALFTDVFDQITRLHNSAFALEFFKVVLTKVDTSDSTADLVSSYVHGAFGRHVIPTPMLKSAAITAAAAGFGTVYDQWNRYPGAAKTYTRAKDSVDAVCSAIHDAVVEADKAHTPKEATA